MAAEQVLTAAQMRAAEEAAIAGGTSVTELMQRAGDGAADWVWRISAGHAVTVLCGPGNNGGDGYVLAEAIRRRGGAVRVVAAFEPGTEAAKAARAAYEGEFAEAAACHGAVLVDCLFGTGLARPLSDELVDLLAGLAGCHHAAVAVDLPSGVAADSGAILQPGLPRFDATLALGSWKPAHWLMPSSTLMGERRLVPIGIDPAAGGAMLIGRPELGRPAADAHKYSRGLLAVVGGEMPGAALLACEAAMRAGAGYVKLLREETAPAPAELVVDTRRLGQALADERIDALLVGPGLGRGKAAGTRLAAALSRDTAAVIDGDGLTLLEPRMSGETPRILTPHAGELATLSERFAVGGETKPARALALARAARAVVVAKGPDTVIAAPDGRLAYAPPAPSWLSSAGTGDVLAGIAASRLATGAEPFAAACEAVWLHGEAARRAGPAFVASELAAAVASAYAAAL